ncbi:MAG: hypothetical protein ACLR4Z_04025 [Butyricicoccaceae bacterium]
MELLKALIDRDEAEDAACARQFEVLEEKIGAVNARLIKADERERCAKHSRQIGNSGRCSAEGRTGESGACRRSRRSSRSRRRVSARLPTSKTSCRTMLSLKTRKRNASASLRH